MDAPYRCLIRWPNPWHTVAALLQITCLASCVGVPTQSLPGPTAPLPEVTSPETTPAQASASPVWPLAATVSPVPEAYASPSTRQPTAVSNPNYPLPSPPVQLEGFKVAYVVLDVWDYQPTLWASQYPYSELRLLVDWIPGWEIYSPTFAWSHAGDRIAFAHFGRGTSVTVSIVDARSSDQTPVDLSLPYHPTSADTPEGYLAVYPEAWSPDDRYFVATNISDIYDEPAQRFRERIQSYIVDPVRGTATSLESGDRFLSWAHNSDPLEYAFLRHANFPDLTEESVCLGQVSMEAPVACIGGFADFDLDIPGHSALAGRMAWPLTGPPILTAVQQGPGEFEFNYLVLALDFGTKSWRLVSRGIPGPVLGISPNGRWLVYLEDTALRLWDMTTSRTHVFTVLSSGVWSFQWSPDSNWLVYQEDFSMRAIPLDGSSDSLLLFDGHDLVVNYYDGIRLWFPDNP